MKKAITSADDEASSQKPPKWAKNSADAKRDAERKRAGLTDEQYQTIVRKALEHAKAKWKRIRDVGQEVPEGYVRFYGARYLYRKDNLRPRKDNKPLIRGFVYANKERFWRKGGYLDTTSKQGMIAKKGEQNLRKTTSARTMMKKDNLYGGLPSGKGISKSRYIILWGPGGKEPKEMDDEKASTKPAPKTKKQLNKDEIMNNHKSHEEENRCTKNLEDSVKCRDSRMMGSELLGEREMGDDGKIHRVMWGRMEHPLTVFVPWDCGHHCPFCTTKAEYLTRYPASRIDYFFTRQKESIRRILAYRFVDEIVLTGGEPLADIPRLQELMRVIRNECRFEGKVYINTSLNFDDEKGRAALDFLREVVQSKAVSGISVSLPYADVRMMNARGFALMKRVHRECPLPEGWMRINSVVKGNESPDQIRRFFHDTMDCDGRRVWSINLRKDYTTCSQANLNDCFDPMMRTLMGMPDFVYWGSGGCLVCRNDVFISFTHGYKRITYHRGVESTSLRYGDLLIMNDLVIKQDGEIRYDWGEGTQLPKYVMDAFSGKIDPSDAEWKWKNPLFSMKMTFAESLGNEWQSHSCNAARARVYDSCFSTKERCG